VLAQDAKEKKENGVSLSMVSSKGLKNALREDKT